MNKYTPETRQQVLDSYRKIGVTKTREQFKVGVATMYRWLAQEKREALLSMPIDENCEEASIEGEDTALMQPPVEDPVESVGTAMKELPTEDSVESSEAQDTDAGEAMEHENAQRTTPQPEDTPVQSQVMQPEEDAPDMLTLLISENEKLRQMNHQLRKALQAFVM